jgi:hypothetical protein
MSHHPTSFLVLDNKELGTFWVGKVNIKPGANDRAIGVDKLIDKLSSKYEEEYPHLCFDVESIACEIYKFHELEKWIIDMLYEINRRPIKLRELHELLTAGWIEGDYTTNSTIHVLRVNKTREGLRDTYKRLISDWEAKGLRCLNTLRCKTDKEKYEDKKQDPTFLYNKARKEILRKIKKTGKMPKDATLEKYQIKEEEANKIMGPTGIIYKISSPSGKVYVGQTVRSFEKRMQQHKQDSSCCTLIKRAIDKYGGEMKYEIIEENVPHEQLDEREIYWISYFNSLAPNGYNCTTGGQYTKEYSQELKDRMRDIKNAQKIEKDGYMGYVSKMYNLFYPKVRQGGKTIRISYGGFQTEEEVVEVLKEYTKDPDNFTPINNRTRKKVGSVRKSRGKWAATYKEIYLGIYDTEEEAHEAIEKYLEDPENVPSFKRNVGNISKSRNKWQLKYKRKYLGSYKTQEEAQEALERYQNDPENFVKPEVRIKYGSVTKHYNKWIVKHKGIFLGSYETQEEGQEALKTHKRDPKNFVKPETKFGCVYFEKGKWRLIYKSKHIGYYPTKEKAEEVREIYLRDPENFVKSDHIPKKIIGSISKRGDRWRLRYKEKQIGTYATKEEAEEVRKTLQSSIYTSSSEIA